MKRLIFALVLLLVSHGCASIEQYTLLEIGESNLTEPIVRCSDHFAAIEYASGMPLGLAATYMAMGNDGMEIKFVGGDPSGFELIIGDYPTPTIEWQRPDEENGLTEAQAILRLSNEEAEELHQSCYEELPPIFSREHTLEKLSTLATGPDPSVITSMCGEYFAASKQGPENGAPKLLGLYLVDVGDKATLTIFSNTLPYFEFDVNDSWSSPTVRWEFSSWFPDLDHVKIRIGLSRAEMNNIRACFPEADFSKTAKR